MGDQEQFRDRHERIRQAHDDVVEPAAGIAGHEAEEGADHDGSADTRQGNE